MPLAGKLAGRQRDASGSVQPVEALLPSTVHTLTPLTTLASHVDGENDSWGAERCGAWHVALRCVWWG